jgi:hypothetical protein
MALVAFQHRFLAEVEFGGCESALADSAYAEDTVVFRVLDDR